ncbi:DUF357 domain-containing protein [Candidatus Woesearchaeota archaeon]|nr:DUF357 domain-containing protein [Candidatus Woesearchaeota archaeon]
MNDITPEKLDKYLLITKTALEKARIHTKKTKESAIILDMTERYLSDAQWFKKKGETANAFAAINYAHGWLDCGARLGILNVQRDNELFTVD